MIAVTYYKKPTSVFSANIMRNKLITAIHGIDVYGDSKSYGQLVDRAFEEYDKFIRTTA